MNKNFLFLVLVLFFIMILPLSADGPEFAGYFGNYNIIKTPLNYYSSGIIIQPGVEFHFHDNDMKLALLGELGGGWGAPFALEYNLGGVLEFYYLFFGIGGGFGLAGDLFEWVGSDRTTTNTPYTRFSLLFRSEDDEIKFCFNGQLYHGTKWDFANIDNWGFGIALCLNIKSLF